MPYPLRLSSLMSLLIAAVLAAAWAGSLWAQEPSGPPPAKVRLGQIDHREVQNRWDVVGRLREVRRSVVAAEVAGKIVGMGVDEGDTVIGGQTELARIDDVWVLNALSRASATLAEAEAQLQAATAQLRQSRLEFDKLARLLEARATPPREYEEAQAAYAADQARVAAAEAALAVAQTAHDLAERERERLSIKAPFDGIVVGKMIEVGEWAQKGSPIVEIVSRGKIDAVIDVPERLVNNLSVGDRIAVQIEALGEQRPGRVAAIVPLGESAARTFPVKVRLDDEGGKLKAGMSAVAHVPTSAKINALTIPRDALVRTPRQTFVWLATSDGQGPMPVATQARVKVLFGSGDRYVIEPLAGSPLEPGSEVVIEGAEGILFPGQSLVVLNGVGDATIAEKPGPPSTPQPK